MGIFRAILGGISRAASRRSEARAARDQTNLEGEWSLRKSNADANQERESLLYAAQLEEWQRQNKRRERARGGANFAQFGAPLLNYVNKAPMQSAPQAAPTPVVRNFTGQG